MLSYQPRIEMNSYSQTHSPSDTADWVPSTSLPSQSLNNNNYHTVLQQHHNPHNMHHHHHHHHSPSRHTNTYPSQHINTNLVDHVAPILMSPSYSQDRESLHSDSLDYDHDGIHTPVSDITTPRSAITPIIPGFQLSSSMCQLPSQKSGFKRSYQPDSNTSNSPAASRSPQPQKRRKSNSKEPWVMSEDENLLLKLKDNEALPWKVIASRFQEVGRGEFRVATLQMRHKRLKEKMRVWEPEEIAFLKEAKEQVEKQKWELVSQKMIELGCKNKIPGSSCEKKWKELCAQPLNTQLQHIQGPNSAGTSPSSAQSCDMKRRFSQLSEDEDGFGLED